MDTVLCACFQDENTHHLISISILRSQQAPRSILAKALPLVLSCTSHYCEKC